MVAGSQEQKCKLKYVMHTRSLDRVQKSGAVAPQYYWEMQNLTKNDAGALQSPYL